MQVLLLNSNVKELSAPILQYCGLFFLPPGNGNKDGLFSVLLRDYNAHAAAACMNRLAKLR